MFYTSNVEQYLFRGDAWQRFYENVGALPIDTRSTFIRAFFNNQGRRVRTCAIRQRGSPRRSRRRLAPSAGPRSETLLNPDLASCSPPSREGHINSYYDVIELSR